MTKTVALTVAGAAQAQPSCDVFPCFPFNFPNATDTFFGHHVTASKAPILSPMLHQSVFGKIHHQLSEALAVRSKQSSLPVVFQFLVLEREGALNPVQWFCASSLKFLAS